MSDFAKILSISEIEYAIERIAKSFFENVKTSHNWNHTLRVVSMCRHIGKIEGNVDIETLVCAAYLHDIGRKYQDESKGTVCHAKKGAELAVPVIEELRLDNSKKENIIHCIRTHRFRGKEKPETNEARILFDSDKLDSIGAIGIARAFLFAGEVGAKLHNPDTDIANSHSYSSEDTGFREFKVKLSKIKDRIFTSEGMKIAIERDKFMKNFFDRFIEEHKGEK